MAERNKHVRFRIFAKIKINTNVDFSLSLLQKGTDLSAACET
jgi:hypothetical protein